MEKGEILIVSFTFPPEQAIGGRRWEKLANYLTKEGFKVHVICAQGIGNQSYFKQNYPHLSVTSIPSGYPAFLRSPNSFLQKICYHLLMKLVSPFSKQNFYDKGVFWNKKIRKATENVIQHNNIEYIISSGAPFSALHNTIRLKYNYPQIKFIADIRDPWTWGTGYGMQGLKSNKKNWQIQQEKEVIEGADLVTFPALSMGEHLKLTYPKHNSKLYQLTHAWDPNDFEASKTASKMESNQKVSFIYGGTLYDGTEKLFSVLAEIKKENHSFEWLIHTFNTDKRKDLLEKQLENYVKIEKVIDSKGFYTKILNYNYYLIYFPERYKDFLSTKFYEVFYSGIPVVYIGYQGIVSEFIEKNGFGVVIKPEDMKEKLIEVIHGKINFPVANAKVLTEYSYPEVTKRFVERFQMI